MKLLDIVNVHDCGRLINPALAEAQVHGGMSMGIGYGLSEQLLGLPRPPGVCVLDLPSTAPLPL